jgi:hypothetical protein
MSCKLLSNISLHAYSLLKAIGTTLVTSLRPLSPTKVTITTTYSSSQLKSMWPTFGSDLALVRAS